MASIVPLIGPLHSREHVLLSFHPFFKNVYQYLFASSKLPQNPKPWCISLLLEVVYGGWTLIRNHTKRICHVQRPAICNTLESPGQLYPASFVNLSCNIQIQSVRPIFQCGYQNMGHVYMFTTKALPQSNIGLDCKYDTLDEMFPRILSSF